ncbi:hypothetical protein E2562_019726 [Oryza meyeriana var. granulata]|uniref:Uncharacterized protein n=1 Tax=Oryza meyeriana var. granulata TaxID=110450 RepID=A0A6G1C8X7_9ORYZ|nr:hypothetical protein E2562_019726 [Oryza meyeriana var. granulata]
MAASTARARTPDRLGSGGSTGPAPAGERSTARSAPHAFAAGPPGAAAPRPCLATSSSGATAPRGASRATGAAPPPDPCLRRHRRSVLIVCKHQDFIGGGKLTVCIKYDGPIVYKHSFVF